MNTKINLDAIRPAPWWLFVLLLAATVVTTVVGNYWFVPSGIWKPLFDRSHGLVNVTLIWGTVYAIVVIVGVLLGIGRRSPDEVGLEWGKLLAAVIYLCVVWVLVQFGLCIWYLCSGNSIDIANIWNSQRVLGTVGAFLGQLLGNALCEEIVFRGFLLVQCLLLFRVLWPDRPTRAFVAALLLTTSIFAVIHVPYYLTPANYSTLSKFVSAQITVFFAGCVFGWIYWQTGNLFFAAGVHALSNVPITLFVWHELGPIRTDGVVFFVAIGIAIVWQKLPTTSRRTAICQNRS